MTTPALSTPTKWLAWAFAAGCALAAILIPVLDSGNAEMLGSILQAAAAVLVVAGLLTYGKTSPWLAVALVTIGALAGGAALVYLVVPAMAALALIVLFGRDALRRRPIVAPAEAP